MERLVSGRRPGDRPGDAPRPEERRHLLRFEVSAETMATFQEAITRLQRDTGEALDQETALLLMARQVLAGCDADAKEPERGRASYQINLSVCPVCQRGRQE